MSIFLVHKVSVLRKGECIMNAIEIIIQFKDSKGKPYNWHIDPKFLREGIEDDSLNAMASAVTGIEVIHTDDKENHLQSYKIRKIDQAARDASRRNKAKLKKELAAANAGKDDAKSTESENSQSQGAQGKAADSKDDKQKAKKAHVRHWIFTPNDVLRLKTSTLIDRLIKYAQNDGDVEIFLSHLRMMKAIYNADCFDLGDRKIDSYPLRELMTNIFIMMPYWTDQVFHAFDEFNYLLTRETRKRVQGIRAKEKKRQAREQVAAGLGEVSADEMNIAETEAAIEEGTVVEPKKKKPTKKQKALMKKLNPPKPKKARSFADVIQQFMG